jgi:hypothetical protein
MGRHTVATYGFDDVRNRAKTTAIIDMVSLRRPMGLQLLRAWAVRTRQVYGVGVGYPPPKWRVIGFHWDRRQPADGARVPHSTAKYDRMNLLLVVRLAPGRTRGRAAGVDVRYQVSGKLYYLPLETALVLKAGPSC